MSESRKLGQTGEDIAADYLCQKGYIIIVRNFRWGRHEVDIIAENKDYIVFVEVKTRSADFLDHPVNAITREKQRSLITAADGFMRRSTSNKETRFDVITIIRNVDDFELDHLERAFYPSLR